MVLKKSMAFARHTDTHTHTHTHTYIYIYIYIYSVSEKLISFWNLITWLILLQTISNIIWAFEETTENSV